MFARIHEDGSSVVLWVSYEGEKEALIASDAEVFVTTPHYDGYPIILVRLDAVDVDELRELVTESWRLRASAREVGAWDAADANGAAE